MLKMNEVETTIENLTGVSFNRNPAAYLLDDTPLSNKKFKNSLNYDC